MINWNISLSTSRGVISFHCMQIARLAVTCWPSFDRRMQSIGLCWRSQNNMSFEQNAISKIDVVVVVSSLGQKMHGSLFWQCIRGCHPSVLLTSTCLCSKLSCAKLRFTMANDGQQGRRHKVDRGFNNYRDFLTENSRWQEQLGHRKAKSRDRHRRGSQLSCLLLLLCRLSCVEILICQVETNSSCELRDSNQVKCWHLIVRVHIITTTATRLGYSELSTFLARNFGFELKFSFASLSLSLSCSMAKSESENMNAELSWVEMNPFVSFSSSWSSENILRFELRALECSIRAHYDEFSRLGNSMNELEFPWMQSQVASQLPASQFALTNSNCNSISRTQKAKTMALASSNSKQQQVTSFGYQVRVLLHRNSQLNTSQLMAASDSIDLLRSIGRDRLTLLGHCSSIRFASLIQVGNSIMPTLLSSLLLIRTE